MIIKDVKYGKGIIFRKKKLQVISDETKTVLSGIELSDEVTNKLKDKLVGLGINSCEDFEKVSNIIQEIIPEKGGLIETAVLNSAFHGWKVIDNKVRQVPRPLCLVLEKDNGIREFYVTSLTTGSFDAVINAAKEVKLLIDKKFSQLGKDKDNIDDTQLIFLVKEAVDDVLKDIDFELRLGVGFNNYSNGKYSYGDRVLDENQQFEFVSRLINDYGLVYVENPFSQGHVESWKKLCSEFMHKGLICYNYNISYDNLISDNLISNGVANTIIVPYENFGQFKKQIFALRENKINVVVDANLSILNQIVGFKIQIMKFANRKDSDDVSRKLLEAVAEMKREYSLKVTNKR